MPIHHLWADCYEGPVSEKALAKTSALTHVGWVRLANGQAVEAILKVYAPLGGETRELVNEFVGHFLAESWGFPVPALAGTVQLQRRHWPDLGLWKRLPKGTRQVVAWWTQREPLQCVKARYNLDVITERHPLFRQQLAKIAAELVAASATPGILAFDEITANVDRNVGNLLGPVGSRYLLIDHGRCLTGEQWLAADLNPARRTKNVLFTLLDATVGLPLSVKSAAVHTFGQIEPKLAESLPALAGALSGALPASDIDAVVSFLRERARRDGAASRMGLVA